MANVTCSRCGNAAAGLETAPLPGKIGAQIVERVCAACWREWMGMQVKIINENRLSPAEPKHFDFLIAQLRTFLYLKDE